MPAKRNSSPVQGRSLPEGFVPEFQVKGTPKEAGRQLGALWREAFIKDAGTKPDGSTFVTTPTAGRRRSVPSLARVSIGEGANRRRR